MNFLELKNGQHEREDENSKWVTINMYDQNKKRSRKNKNVERDYNKLMPIAARTTISTATLNLVNIKVS